MNDSKPPADPSEKEDDLLDLPDAPDFTSKPPALSVAENIRLCEKMLPAWNKKRFEKLAQEEPNFEPFYL